VGTRNATKILKDGDMVEVDADKDIVKIVEALMIGKTQKRGYKSLGVGSLNQQRGEQPISLAIFFAIS